jgi:hypothetical protein
MVSFRRFCRSIAYPLALIMFLVSVPWGAPRAALVTTDTIIDSLSVEKDRQAVLSFLDREEVVAQFRSLGLSPDEAKARVAAMSDQELRQIAGHIDQLPAGQSAIGVIVGAALLIFIILLITDLLGLTDVFPFVTAGKKR